MRPLVLLLIASARWAALPAAADAQLRPYDPISWEMYEGETTLSAQMGVAAHFGQRASLLGTEGTLIEAGEFRASWRSGQIILEASGVPWRMYREKERYAPPQAEVEPQPDGNASDAGDYLLSTTVSTPAKAPVLAALRFGTRLPTTNNRVGLERDQTDFFAMAGARWQGEGVDLGGEIGVGLHGTRDPKFEQSDVLTYAAALRLKQWPLTPEFSIVGHADALRGRAIRGNEELAEARLRLRAGQARWVELQLAGGLTHFSPALGIGIFGGFTR